MQKINIFLYKKNRTKQKEIDAVNETINVYSGVKVISQRRLYKWISLYNKQSATAAEKMCRFKLPSHLLHLSDLSAISCFIQSILGLEGTTTVHQKESFSVFFDSRSG